MLSWGFRRSLLLQLPLRLALPLFAAEHGARLLRLRCGWRAACKLLPGFLHFTVPAVTEGNLHTAVGVLDT